MGSKAARLRLTAPGQLRSSSPTTTGPVKSAQALADTWGDPEGSEPRLLDWRQTAARALLILVLSRLLVLVAGVVGAQVKPRIHNWSAFDPLQLSSGLGQVGNAVAATGLRWDSLHYLNLAGHGYASRSETVFFPLYPLLIHAVSLAFGSAVVAGFFISLLSFGIALALLHRLTELELGRVAADAAVLLLAFAPLAYFFSAVYSEPLFLALSVGATYAARRGRWGLAGILAALSAVTRVPGILLVVLLAGLYLRQNRRVDVRIAWLLFAPLCVAGFLAYLAARGYGWLAPITNQIGKEHAHRLAGPLSTVVSAIKAGVNGAAATARGQAVFAPPLPFGPFSGPFESFVLLVVLLLAAGALFLTFRRLPLEYGVYGTLTLLVCVYSPTIVQPLQSLDRYTLTIFPLWMAAGSWLSHRKAVLPVVVISACLLAFYSYEAARWFFIA